MHDQIGDLPDADLLIHAGDFSGHGTVFDVARLFEWFDSLRGRFPLGILFVAGNHDMALEENNELGRQSPTICTYLQDGGVTLANGLKVYGAPWQPLFHNWAFQLQRGEELKRKWDLIPDDTDILVTHGPPMGIMDTNPHDDRIGDQDLLDAVRRIKPKLHVFGHAHDGHGVQEIDGTIFVNAAICTEQYAPINEPIVVTV